MTEITTKTCSKCNAEKPIAEYGKKQGNRDGMANFCKSCISAASASYRKNNPEKTAAATTKWRAVNPEKLAATAAGYRKNNEEKIADYQAKFYKNNSEKIGALRRHQRKEDPEKIALARLKTSQKAKKDLSDSYIKGLLCHNTGIPSASIPGPLVELKRAQIQISNYLKEQAK